jgi:hypothetical protein
MSWNFFAYAQVDVVPKLAKFYTDIDKVDIRPAVFQSTFYIKNALTFFILEL